MRFLLILLVLFCASRALIRALPGDPLDTLVAETGTSVPREALASELGLDRPFLESLSHDFARAVRGDFGRSIISREPVAPILQERFKNTLVLTLAALSLALLVSVALGLLAAPSPGSRADRFCTFYGSLNAALPMPWKGPILIYLLAVVIPLFEIGYSLSLPALALSLGFSGLWSRLIRERVRETLGAGAAPGARARGVPEWKVLLKYGLAPCAGSLLAYLGTQLGALLSGAFVAEVIFDWPGMGSLLVEAVLRRDYPVVESCVFLGAAVALLGTLLGDWAQNLADPRLEKLSS